MSPRSFAAAAALVLAATPALAGYSAYDFSADAAGSVVTPATIGLATLSSPADPGAYTFGPNAGLYSYLGPYTLSAAGVPAPLVISFATPQNQVGFRFALGDFLGVGGNDTISVSVNGGPGTPATATLLGGDFYPESSFEIGSGDLYPNIDTLTITSAYAITISDLSSVPEPAALALLGAGLAGLLVARRRA